MKITVINATRRLLSLVGIVGISAGLTLPVLAQEDNQPKSLTLPVESEPLAPAQNSGELIRESVPTPEFPTSTDWNNAARFWNNVDWSSSEFIYFGNKYTDRDQYFREWIFR